MDSEAPMDTRFFERSDDVSLWGKESRTCVPCTACHVTCGDAEFEAKKGVKSRLVIDTGVTTVL